MATAGIIKPGRNKAVRVLRGSSYCRGREGGKDSAVGGVMTCTTAGRIGRRKVAMAIEELLGQLTLEEKCSLLSGSAFWYTQAVEDLGIRRLMLTDGPHGLRKQVENADHLGLNKSVPATCFPPAAALAASWNEELIYEMGEALGIECRAENVDVLLGPGANIKRSPLCGRNFEYFSEDPYLASRLAKAHITGLQSKGVGASIKHFAANNQETRRLTINAKVDERTLREIYLASFETAIKEGKPWTVMCAYNRLNGEFGSENKKVLNDILRDEWGYEGLVVTDWGATNDRVKGLEAGQDLEMPSSGGVNDSAVLEAVQEGKISEAQVDVSVRRLLELIAKADEKLPVEPFIPKKHHELAQKIASECIVLLKNEEQVLPLAKTEKIALIGEFAVKSRIQGGGSSHINPTFWIRCWRKCKSAAAMLFYMKKDFLWMRKVWIGLNWNGQSWRQRQQTRLFYAWDFRKAMRQRDLTVSI